MKKILLITAALLPAWSAANAEDNGMLRVRAGVGAQVKPKYPGADSGRIAPLFNFSIAKGNEPFRFKAPDDAFSLPVISSGRFAAGPAADFVGSRKDKDVGVPLGKVKSTIEVGAFARYYLGETLRLRGQALKGVNGHKGVIGQVGLDKIWRDGDRYVFSIGPRVTFADSRYERAYFGVTPDQALRTGLPTYRPSGGIHSLALASGLNKQLGGRVGLFGYGRFERLVGDAAKSPVVRLLGSRNQWSGGVGLNYTFAVQR